MIVVCSSSTFKTLYPENTNSNFRVSLSRSYLFPLNARVALREIFLPPSKTAQIGYLYCSIVSHSQVGESCRKILRVINVQASDKVRRIDFPSPLLFELSNTTVDDIKFSIKTKDEHFIKFDEKEATIIIIEIQ